MSSRDLTARSNTDLKVYDPTTNSREIVALDAAKRLAEKIKDPAAYEKAALRQLEAEIEFAKHYRAQYGQGARSDLTSAISGASYCKQFGWSDRTVQRWGERIDDPAKLEAKKNEIGARAVQMGLGEMAANYSSDSVEWYTPPKYLEAVRAVLGEIDLDPASCEEANETVQAAEFYTDNGLEQDWHGRVFMNPPYGKNSDGSLASQFCDKAIAEHEHGNTTETIILVNSSHSQNWQAVLYEYPVCFVDHRINFVSGDGEENKNPTFQNIFVYLGPDKHKFAREFSQFGYVMERIPT